MIIGEIRMAPDISVLILSYLTTITVFTSCNCAAMFPKMFNITFLYFICIYFSSVKSGYTHGRKPFDCGRYGFVCEKNNRLRLCDKKSLYGPTFICPANTICNEDSADVCEDAINYIDPTLRGILKCRRNERLADPTVPGCKGYILCVPNKKTFQAIKFKCSGNTIFNGISRTCSSPQTYKCPLTNLTTISLDSNRRGDIDYDSDIVPITRKPVIDCKSYKFRVRQDSGPVGRVAFFCPKRPAPGIDGTRCTVFSNQFCLSLQRVDEDQFTMNAGIAHRKPRLMRYFTP